MKDTKTVFKQCRKKKVGSFVAINTLAAPDTNERAQSA